jgi:hypothetical protein
MFHLVGLVEKQDYTAEATSAETPRQAGSI